MTATTENVCADCGNPAPVYTLLETEIPMRYCEPCSTRRAIKEDERERAESLDLTLKRAGATPRLLAMSLTTHPDHLAATFAGVWLDDYRTGTRRNLWLSGSVGLGKTGLAWGIVRELAVAAVDKHWATDEVWRGTEPPLPALFLRWADLLTDLKAAFSTDPTDSYSDPSDLLERAKRIPVLALDDLGRERPTAYAVEKLGNLVNERYERLLPTVVTSNYDTKELGVRLTNEGGSIVEAKRIIDRLVEDATTYRFDGAASRRRPA